VEQPQLVEQHQQEEQQKHLANKENTWMLIRNVKVQDVLMY
jgi:hypothetical protein